MKHITAGLLTALLVAPNVLIANEAFTYQPTDPIDFQTVAAVDERIAELDTMIAALEAERKAIVSQRAELQGAHEQLRASIKDLVGQLEKLDGDTSGIPSESEQQHMSTYQLQNTVSDLLMQIAELQNNLDNNQTSICPYTWTRDLRVGDAGLDVKKLQQFLNTDPDTPIVAFSGSIAPGMETEEFIPAVAAAVSKFQVKYRSDILSPQNLTVPTGNFDSYTRAKANSFCIAKPSDSDVGDDARTVVRDTDDDGWIYGTDGDDYYYGDDREQILVGSVGDDRLYGDDDWDEVNYVGPTDCAANFSISYTERDSVVEITSKQYGTDLLYNIEGVYFAGCGDWVRL